MVMKGILIRKSRFSKCKWGPTINDPNEITIYIEEKEL
jgi:hypothetical protein